MNLIKASISAHFAATVLVAAVTFSVSNAHGESRTWTSSDGRYLSGEIEGLDGDTVKLKTAAGVFEFPLERLSEANKEFAREWKKNSQPAGVPAGVPNDASDRTVGDFSNLTLGEWPKLGAVKDSS